MYLVLFCFYKIQNARARDMKERLHLLHQDSVLTYILHFYDLAITGLRVCITYNYQKRHILFRWYQHRKLCVRFLDLVFLCDKAQAGRQNAAFCWIFAVGQVVKEIDSISRRSFSFHLLSVHLQYHIRYYYPWYVTICFSLFLNVHWPSL